VEVHDFEKNIEKISSSASGAGLVDPEPVV
jgi:hypothetical protein